MSAPVEERIWASAWYDAERLVTRRGFPLALAWGRAKLEGAPLRIFETAARQHADRLARIDEEARRKLRLR